MTAVVRNSVLNPLATCFVPSSVKTFNTNKTTSVKSVPNDSDENSQDKRTVEKLNCPLTTNDIAHIRKKFVFGKRCGGKRLERKINDSTTVLVLEINSVISENISKVEAYKPTSDVMKAFGICNLILLAILKLLYNQWFSRDKVCLKPPTAAKIERSKEDEKCRCPPMFGWVLPPTFFGNPFNLKYDCCKNYVHSARYIKGNQKKVVDIRSMQQIDKWESCISEGKETLEECSFEFQMIIRDVCNSVRNDGTSSQGQEYFKLCGRKDQLNYQKSSVWNNLVEKTWNEETLVDDGTHPLLESLFSGNSINEDEVHESIQDVEEILEKCLLGKESQSNEVLTTAICNPPCSVWCDFLPADAKDSFLRFLSKSQQNMNTKIVARRKPVGRKHIYERSFSADDAPKYANLGRDWNSTSEVECRRLMLLRKEPVVRFGLNKKERRSSHRQLKAGFLSTERKSSMWGPFDGTDSLWQPLPDCVPAGDCNQKQNCNRKSREMRRQRSTN